MMDEIILSVADKDILFSTDMDSRFISKYFKQGTNPSLKLICYKAKPNSIISKGRAGFFGQDSQYNGKHQCMIYRELNDKISTHITTMLLAYITDMNSEKYNAIHGCGMIIRPGNKDRGILLVGRGGSGKTTLGKTLGKGSILDDDVLIIDDKRMQTVGIHGAITYMTYDGKKYLKYQEDGVSEADIDAIFILDRQKDGGYIKEMERNIPRIYSTFDILESGLYELSTNRPPINVNVPVYIIGTRNDASATRKSILSVL